MALVHSRARRVIYVEPDAVFGVLGSRAMLHEHPSLNHRYEVFVHHYALQYFR